jgi:hypothetical protein
MLKIYTNGNLAKETMSQITDLPYELTNIYECNIAIIMVNRKIELEANEDTLLEWNKQRPVFVCFKTTEEDEEEICKYLTEYGVSTGVDYFLVYKSSLMEVVKSIIRRELISSVIRTTDVNEFNELIKTSHDMEVVKSIIRRELISSVIRTTDVNEFNELIKTPHDNVYLIDTQGRPIKSFEVYITEFNTEWIDDYNKINWYPTKEIVSFSGKINKFELEIFNNVSLYKTIRICKIRFKFDGKDCNLEIHNNKAYISNFGSINRNEINWDKICYSDKEKLLNTIDKVRESVIKLEISNELKDMLLNKYLKLEENYEK